MPLACLVAFEAGVAVFGSPAAGLSRARGVARALLLRGRARRRRTRRSRCPEPRRGSCSCPPRSRSSSSMSRSRRWPTSARSRPVFGALALVHPTYALFALLPLAGYALVRLERVARARRSRSPPAIVPDGARVPLAAAARARDRLARPEPGREGARARSTTAACSSSARPTSYRLAAEVVGRTGAVAVAALALVPLAGLAVRRRRWAAFVLGGTVARARADARARSSSRASPTPSRSRSRAAPPGSCRSRSPSPAGSRCSSRRVRGSCRSRCVAGIAAAAAGGPATSTTASATAGRAIVTWWALVGGAAALGLGLAFAAGCRRSRSGTCSARRGRRAVRAAGRRARLPRVDAAA